MATQVEQQIDFEEYENILKNSKQSTFYHSRNHLSFLADLLKLTPNFLTIRENNNLKGVLPFFVKKSIHGSVVNSLPFFGSYGGCVSDNIKHQKLILEHMNNFNKENDVLSSVIVVSPFCNNYSVYEKYYNFQIKEDRLVQCLDINNNSEQNIWNSFEQRVRRAVRKSMKLEVNSIKIKPDDDVFSNFYELHKKDMESKNGKPKPLEFFQCLKNNFSEGKDYDIFSAKKDGDNIAYLLVFYFHPFTEYYMPAYDSELKNLQAPSLLIWESIKESISKKNALL